MTRAIRDCRNCGGAGCRECGNEGIEDVACFTPPASFTVRSDEVGFEDDRENCPCYEGVKINDGVDQCLHPDNRTAGNWCALDTCPLLRPWRWLVLDAGTKQREVARIGDMHQADALPAVPDGWQPIDTIPKDERRVELLSANGKTDRGNWAARPDWIGQTDDVQDYLNTDNGEGDYTHWRDIAATPAHDQPEGEG